MVARRILLGVCEPSPVSDHLEDIWKHLYDDSKLDHVEHVVVDIGKGPIQRFVSTLMHPFYIGYLVTRSKVKGSDSEICTDRSTRT